ncbi:uncharacterized protein LOC129718901 [Wyeomyia smithii]|uniref:uncharacterized protein LOC129718901 n=1 Tax=Wyeomyia smithii TaxID=174621 RepID=UPI002467DE96|nr:uncharacterized protein LOC129718901 [Wyeomyia smithii]
MSKKSRPYFTIYADWLTSMAKTHVASTKNNNTLAKKLLKAMDKRSKTLRDSMPFKACLNIDPRFNFVGSNRLTADEKNDIQKYLLALHIRLNDIEGLNDDKCEYSDKETISDDFVEEYLACFFEEKATPNLNSSNSADTDSLMAEIMKLETRPKVPITESQGVSVPMPSTSSQDPSSTAKLQTSQPFDIMKYWKQRKVSSPRLYRIAMALLSIPSTQVTVERLFSHSRLVLTDSRTKLSDKMVKDILLLKMNKNLWPEVIEILLSEL